MSSYRVEGRTGTVSDVCEAIQSLLELGEECREIVDNASGSGLENTQRIQTLEETASALENVGEPDIPLILEGLEITYSVHVQTRKGRGESRAIRRYNAVAVIDSAIEASMQLLEELQSEWEDYEELSEEEQEEKGEPEVFESELAYIEEFIDSLEEIKSEVEALEFPGMFG